MFPMSRVRLLSALLAVVALLTITGVAAAQDPAGVAVPGALVAGVDVSGMDYASAVATLNGAFNQTIQLQVGEQTYSVTNGQLGLRLAIPAAVSEALARTAAGNTPVTYTSSERQLQKQVARIMRAASTAGVPAAWSLGVTRPKIVGGTAGLAPNQKLVEQQITRAIGQPLLRAQQDPIALVASKVTTRLADLGYVITISKQERLLRVWAPVRNEAKVVRTWRVALGQPEYPTPTGSFKIVVMQKDPWWIPPASDWAKDEKPVPPGPNNPLGTRWMGLDRQDIGIHGTPDSGSLGQYASHGCIRMLIASAEKLYSMVEIDTPVTIF